MWIECYSLRKQCPKVKLRRRRLSRRCRHHLLKAKRAEETSSVHCCSRACFRKHVRHVSFTVHNTRNIFHLHIEDIVTSQHIIELNGSSPTQLKVQANLSSLLSSSRHLHLGLSMMQSAAAAGCSCSCFIFVRCLCDLILPFHCRRCFLCMQ